jgi:hypothetical protein
MKMHTIPTFRQSSDIEADVDNVAEKACFHVWVAIIQERLTNIPFRRSSCRLPIQITLIN